MTGPPVQPVYQEGKSKVNRARLLFRVRNWLVSHPGKAGTLAGWYQQAGGALAAFITYPLIIKRLTEAQAGIWFSFQVGLGAINLADFGLSFVLSRQVAYTLHLQGGGGLHKTDFIETGAGWAGVGEVYGIGRRLFAWTSAIATLLLAVLYFVVMHFGKLAVYRSNQTLFAWCFLGIGTILSLQAKPSQAVIEGCGKVYLARFVIGSCQVLTGLGIIAALLLGAGLGAMAISVCAAQAIQWIVLRNLALSQGSLRKSHDVEPTAGLVGKFLRVALPMGVLNLSAFLVSSVQVPLLGMVVGPRIVPPFYLAQKIGQMLNLVIMQIAAPQMPLFTKELANAERIKAYRRGARTTAIAATGALAANLFFFVASPLIVSLWLGRKHYVDRATLGLMSLDYFLLALASFCAQFVFASGRNPFVVTTVLNALLNVAMIFVLCPHLGLVGIPVATLCSGLITNYWYAVFEGIRLLKELRGSNERARILL